MIVFIYGLRDPVSGRVRYVGRSVNPARRLLEHKVSGGTATARWIRALGYLPDIVIYQAITDCKTLNDPSATRAEARHIKRLDAAGEPIMNVQHCPRNQKYSKYRM